MAMTKEEKKRLKDAEDEVVNSRDLLTKAQKDNIKLVKQLDDANSQVEQLMDSQEIHLKQLEEVEKERIAAVEDKADVDVELAEAIAKINNLVMDLNNIKIMALSESSVPSRIRSIVAMIDLSLGGTHVREETNAQRVRRRKEERARRMNQ